MFNKIISWMYQKQIINQRKEEIKNNLSKREKKIKNLHKHFQELAQFVKWINTKALKNRRQRKSFWRNVSEGHGLVEDILEQMIDRYEPELLPEMTDLNTQIRRAERKLENIKRLLELLKSKKKTKEIKKDGYNPPPKNGKRPEKPTSSPPPKEKIKRER